MNRYSWIAAIAVALLTLIALPSCDNSKSYADQLTDENHDVNRFLANQRVEGSIPADTVFEVGTDAPYYRLDEEGNVFMQVLSIGKGEHVVDDQVVYFRYIRYSLADYTPGEILTGEGNANNMGSNPTFFRFNNMSTVSLSQYGEGIQMPMKYLPLDSKVNIVIKSQYGATNEISYVVPYLYTVSYYKSQI